MTIDAAMGHQSDLCVSPSASFRSMRKHRTETPTSLQRAALERGLEPLRQANSTKAISDTTRTSLPAVPSAKAPENDRGRNSLGPEKTLSTTSGGSSLRYDPSDDEGSVARCSVVSGQSSLGIQGLPAERRGSAPGLHRDKSPVLVAAENALRPSSVSTISGRGARRDKSPSGMGGMSPSSPSSNGVRHEKSPRVTGLAAAGRQLSGADKQPLDPVGSAGFARRESDSSGADLPPTPAGASQQGAVDKTASDETHRPKPPDSPAGVKKPPSSLFARRNLQVQKPMNVDTEAISDETKDARLRPADPVPKEQVQNERKRIKRVESVLDFYDLGKMVMPSCHRGMEVVFGKNLKTKTEVVIKVRKKGNSFHDENSEMDWRMSTEFVLNLPEHLGIAKVYEVLEDKDGYYVIMEKVPGQDLFEQLASKGLLSVMEVKEVMRQLLLALKEMHDRGAIHRDLKLENVMFQRLNPTPGSPPSDSDSGLPSSPVSVKLIDFDTVQEYKHDMLPHTRDVMGTDQYIAQEAYDGIYTPASDIFAVGVIGYRLLTGRFPYSKHLFDDEAGENWVGSPKMREIRRRLCKFNIDYSYKIFGEEPQAKTLIRWMMSTDASKRPGASDALNHPFLANQNSERLMTRHATMPARVEDRVKSASASPGAPPTVKRHERRRKTEYATTLMGCAQPSSVDADEVGKKTADPDPVDESNEAAVSSQVTEECKTPTSLQESARGSSRGVSPGKSAIRARNAHKRHHTVTFDRNLVEQLSGA